MSAKSTWMATAVGTAVGTGAWAVGLGRDLWPAHPWWALFFLTLAVSIATQLIVERHERQERQSKTGTGKPPP